MLFFLRFKSQLRRTRPGLVPRLEEAVVRAVENAGGKITGDRRLLTAAFNGDSLGFWLDILILIETLARDLEGASADLYGYSLVLGRDLDNPAETPQAPEAFCHFLAGGSRGGGVFLDPTAGEGLFPYVNVEEPERWTSSWMNPQGAADAGNFRAAAFCRLEGIKTYAPSAEINSLRKSVVHSLGHKPGGLIGRRSTLLLGPAFAGKRGGLYQYGEKLAGDIPPLRVRFGGGGLTALTDAWAPPIQSLAGTGTAAAAEISRIWEFLFRERLREDLSVFVIQKARRFLTLLLECYTAAARRKGRPPVLILENVHLAEQTAADLFIEVYGGLKGTPGLVTLGIFDESGDDKDKIEENIKKWEKVFHRMLRPTIGGEEPRQLPPAPPELWEIGYALSLLGRYFPDSLMIRLFEEEGKNPVMISRAVSLLSALGFIDAPRESRPWMDDFDAQAETVLGERGERARTLVRRRLLAWVEHQKISPCFRFLMILTELGGAEHLTDSLILKSIISDLVNGTAAGIEQARNKELLQSIAGPERTGVLRYIFETTRALIADNTEAIRAAFTNPPPDCGGFPVLKAQALTNLAAYHLGLRDNASAMETVKEAILLSQRKNDGCLARSYRLFSLVSLSKQQTGETIDYLGFAMENAEKSGDYHELGVSAYYAATAQFLFGNVSRAALLARTAREQALALGCSEWADRSRFLEGRFAFETGRYQDALEIFETLQRETQNAAGDPPPEKERLLSAWAYRARVYFQNPLSPKPADSGHDADLFEVEAAYLAGDYQKTVELAGALTNPHSEENFLYTEQPDWRSGFAQCELLYFSRGELWDRMICVYHSLALCRISAAGGEEAMYNMQRILKNEQLSEMDPWDAFYFYAWYRILEQTGAGQVDMNTAVSMAFKRLQRRASRIEDVETRRQFLFQPRWNSALSLAAKEFKLI
jgi:hypothetical protein